MPLILQFQWGNETADIYTATSKGSKTFCNWCKLWNSHNRLKSSENESLWSMQHSREALGEMKLERASQRAGV